MLKELFIAIILGALLGFGATGAYFAITHEKPTTAQEESQNQTQEESMESNSTQDNTNSDNQNQISNTSQVLNILSPETETYTDKATTTIKGTAAPQAAIIITTPTDSYQTVASDSGSFEIDIDLEAGANLITIDSIDSQNIQNQSQIIITYTTAKI